jgi:thioredoxin reductase (NADPH)
MIAITMYGTDWCPDCRRAKAFLEEYKITFDYINVEIDEDATRRVEAVNDGKRIIPTFVIGDQTYTNPDNAALARVLGINETGRVVFYGADWCPDCRRAKSYLQDNGMHYMFIDIDANDWAIKEVEQINSGKRSIPTILIDVSPYTNPDNATLRDVLKIDHEEESKCFDTVIVGAGAAGLTVSIYVQRDRFDSLILERKNIGGNAFLTQTIANYPGFTEISGPQLMERMAEQAQTYGAEIKQGVEVLDILKTDDEFHLKTNLGDYRGRSIVIAVGSTYRRLEIPGEEELIGAGIHFCATCDGAFYRDQEVIIIGGGNSALEEGIFLAGFCKKVKIIHRSPEFSASSTYIEKLPSIDNIETCMDKTSLEFLANEKGTFRAIKVKDNQTGETSEITAAGVFIFIGLTPNTAFLKDIVDLDEQGYVFTHPGCVETSVPGMFGAGDCRKGAIAQVAAATGEGVIASYGVREYLKK